MLYSYVIEKSAVFWNVCQGQSECIVLWTCFKRKNENKTSCLSSSCCDIYMDLHEKLEELWDHQDVNVTGYSLRAVYGFTHFPKLCWQVFPVWLVYPLISSFSVSCLLSLSFLFSCGIILRFIKIKIKLDVWKTSRLHN